MISRLANLHTLPYCCPTEFTPRGVTEPTMTGESAKELCSPPLNVWCLGV